MSAQNQGDVIADRRTDEERKREEEKKNIQVTLQLADDIYKVMKDKRMLEYSADDRHKIVLQKYKNFADMYPVVLRIMARDIRYNHTAFEKMLEKMLRDQKAQSQTDEKKRGSKQRDPLDAMRAFITHQADYARFLYIEETKRMGRHIDMRKARAIWQIEYGNMNKALKKIKKDEDSARNEFEEEKKKHLDEKRQELLEFLMAERGDVPDDENAPEDSESQKSRELTKEEKEQEELQELQGYCADLSEAYKSFQQEDIMPGIASTDLEEYSYVLQYCQHLFDIAVKHEKMTLEDRETYENQISFCMSAIENEYDRRAKIVEEARKKRDAQWLEGLPTLRKPTSRKKKRGGRSRK